MSTSTGPSSPSSAGTSNSSSHPQPLPPVATPMALPTPKDVPFAPLQSTATTADDPPFATPHLPPIATARPVGHLSGIPTTNRPQPTTHLPVIATQVPLGVNFEHTNLRYLDATRWMAGLMLAYYVGTFVFLQPFFLGVVGMLTAFIGYFGARAPMDAVRMKWVRSYLYLNYVMILFNVWLLGIAFIYSSRTDLGPGTTIPTDDEDAHAYYSSQGLGIAVALLVALNVMLHVRGIQTSRALYLELVRARMQSGEPAVIIMTHVA